MRKKHNQGLLGNKSSAIPKKIVSKLKWEKLKTTPGDVILFGAYTPHRSGSNNTKKPRRMMYLTYNAKKDGDLRNLSGGEFQRVLIARAIAKKPDLLVLDEPVQGVDFKGELSLYKLIKKISDELGCGILLISHDLHVVMSATDYVVCLNGHVCCSGTPQSVVNDSKYKELFGDRASTILSVYEHRHDHTHSPDGTIKRKQ